MSPGSLSRQKQAAHPVHTASQGPHPLQCSAGLKPSINGLKIGLINRCFRLAQTMKGSIGAEFSLLLGRINPGPWTQSVNKPVTTPTLNPSAIINNPVTGSFARSKKAASPIVAVNVANTEPKLRLPETYRVTTMIAPPHPGKAPRAAAKGTCQRPAPGYASVRSNLKSFSREKTPAMSQQQMLTPADMPLKWHL